MRRKPAPVTLEDVIAALAGKVSIDLRCEPEDIPFVGNCMASGDGAEDKRCEDWIRRQLRKGNEWAWCHVIVTVRWAGMSESDSLGCCSYRSEADFRQPGGYFDDMVSEATRRLAENLMTRIACMADLGFKVSHA